MTDRVNMSWNDWNSQLEKARADEREKVLSEVDRMIETHINHLYPMTFANSHTGVMSRGKQLPTHIARLEPMDIEALDQLGFIRTKLADMKARK